MNNALFVFQKRGTNSAGQEVMNENYLNFGQAISAYWQEDPDRGGRVLSVFVPTYTFTFSEKVGERFLREWNAWLSGLHANHQRTQTTGANPAGPRKPRAAMPTAEDIIEDPERGAPAWESGS